MDIKKTLLASSAVLLTLSGYVMADEQQAIEEQVEASAEDAALVASTTQPETEAPVPSDDTDTEDSSEDGSDSEDTDEETETESSES